MATEKIAARIAVKSYVIVRGSLATFCGVLEAQEGREVLLSNARMIGYWEKRHMLSTLAQRGPVEDKIRMSDATAFVHVLDATGIIVCSDEAAVALQQVTLHEVKLHA